MAAVSTPCFALRSPPEQHFQLGASRGFAVPCVVSLVTSPSPACPGVPCAFQRVATAMVGPPPLHSGVSQWTSSPVRQEVNYGVQSMVLPKSGILAHDAVAATRTMPSLPAAAVGSVPVSPVPAEAWAPPTVVLGPGIEVPGIYDSCGRCRPGPMLPYAEGSDGRCRYIAFLELLSAAGRQASLPADRDGVFRVNVPFCGTFSEADLVANFLKQSHLTRPGVGSVAIVGADVNAEPAYWPLWQNFFRHPRMRLELRQQDLAAVPLPPAALTLAVHPRAFAVGEGDRRLWEQIMRNAVRSTPQGLCAFALFTRQEADQVVRLCTELGARCEPILESSAGTSGVGGSRSTDFSFALGVLGTDYLRFFVFAWTGGTGLRSAGSGFRE
eukprot:TRINITY_DN45004_c0_g1_i1.p1 TRINITY_DN45004_c0_g1~~TRINITY_DN45004_c0_g1_i1.p1  ORF type:complete len:384 (-),score=49.07 TRINITY_DN45004_c0_g1_i1:91-1242(-)